MAYKYNPFTGTLDEVGAGGGGGSTSPGGSTTQVQFNDGGAFAGDADLTWNKTTNVLGITGDVNLSDGGTYTTTLQTITPTAARTISLPDATGTVALVAGSSGQLLYNNAGVNAGTSTVTYDGSILTTSGRFINSYNATASSPAKAFTGTWFTGGTGTTTKPQVLIEPTGATSTAWSTSGTGLGVNAASGFAGNLLDLQVNGTSRVNVDTNGQINIPAPVGSTPLGVFVTQSIRLGWNDGGFGGAVISSGGLLAWSSQANPAKDQIADLRLARDAANTLAQRNGTAAQTFRCYGTYTDASNYVRAALSSSSTAVTLAAETAGTGADDIPLNLTAAGTGTIKVNSNLEVSTKDIVTDTTTGTKIGTATTQKLSFWNTSPVVQPTTAISAATFVASSGGNIHPTSTFDGYTIAQVVAALRSVGILA
jgi:hypothetical protein